MLLACASAAPFALDCSRRLVLSLWSSLRSRSWTGMMAGLHYKNWGRVAKPCFEGDSLPVLLMSSVADAYRECIGRCIEGSGSSLGGAMVQSVAVKPGEIVLLSGHDLRRLLKPKVVIEALREAYAALADNRGDQGRSLGFTVDGGSIHVKSGLLPGSHLAFAAKVNVNLPDNWKLRQLPTIQGVVVVSDAKDGRPLAILDSISLTGIRTAATAALAAGYGARKDSKRAAIIGCGVQAKYQFEAAKAIFPLETVRGFDIDSARAEAFARANATGTCVATPAPSVREAVRDVDICIMHNVEISDPYR